MPMERCIGQVKGTFGNLSSIDMNLAIRALKTDLLNPMPQREVPNASELGHSKLDQRIAEKRVTFHDTSTGVDFIRIPPLWVTIQEGRFRDWLQHGYPMVYDDQAVRLHIKIQLTWKLSIGSQFGQRDQSNTANRDDSYISYRYNGQQKIRYGRVVIFCKVYNCWDDLVVLIREFKTVRIKAEWRLPWLKDDTLGPVKSILHTEIIGAIGFIKKVEETQTVTYVTTHWSEKKEKK